MSPAKKDEVVVSVDGHRLTLTHLDKVLYPSTGTTKADVLQYYSAIADVMIPHVRDRAATRKRWVHGVGTAEHPESMFFQKNLGDGVPSWVKRRAIEHSDHDNEYPLVNDRATLTWLGQIAALELHVPQWRFGRNGARHNPDRLVLDLDPGEGVGLAECAEIARWARVILQGMGLEPMPVTSGSKGIHLYAALDGSQTSDEVSAVAHELARVLEADHPDLVVSDMKKTLRVGKVLVDWSQNNGSKTTVAPYSLRGRLEPTVAAPRTWRELASSSLAQLSFEQVLERVKKRGDPLAVLLGGGAAAAPGAAAAAAAGAGAVAGGAPGGGGAADDPVADRLHTYRSMRDGAKTPEPVPDAAPAPSAGNTFVIQKHDATRLHYDFRLEHDGVLVSWAIPKGPPTEMKVNHLAVQTEDHPLEYASFAGTIPKGEYGGGSVEIWDEGTYDLEKWREGKEVIATLHGTKEGGLGGDRKFVLIHTGSGGGSKAAQNWLIHLMELHYSPESEKRHAALPPQPDDEAPAINGRLAATASKPATAKPATAKPAASKPAASKPGTSKPATAKPATAKPAAPDEPTASSKPAAGSTAAPPGKADGEAPVVSPMLATLGSEADFARADSGDEWAFEMKWDGIRAVASIDRAGVRLISRNGNDLTAQYPDLLDPLRALATDRELTLDGEIIALDSRGRPSFSSLQQRMNLLGSADVDRAAKSVAAHYVVFDILHLDGRSLLKHPYDDRRRTLEETVAPDARSRVQVPTAFEGDFARAFAASRDLGLEGVVAKKHSSTYTAGRRSKAWLKVKHHLTQEVVVAGWRPGAGRRSDGVGSLLLGVPSADGLAYVGRVGTGFSDADLKKFSETFRTIDRTTSPFADVPRDVASDAHWLEPTLVGEVEFAEWTASGHLRQPSWRGWRADKAVKDVVRES